MSEKGGWKRGGHFMAVLTVLAVCSELLFLKSLGLVMII